MIAESIESEAQLAVLSKCGCRFGKGYLLGRPLPLEDLILAFLHGRPLTT